ncbi:MAG: cyclic nucleotide-binding domain-containing protein [Crocinitomicaceae bacterium]
MINIRQYLDQYVKLTDEEWEIFSSKLIKEKLPKKSLLLLKGEVESHLSFVNKGIVRYYIDKKESQYTFGFAFEQEFASAYDSFLTQTPSRYYVEALTEVELYRITFEDLQNAYAMTENGNAIGRALAEELYLYKFSREMSNQHESATDRYEQLITKQPYFLKQIPLQYIASYIGVTPQTLSKIRKRIS